MRVETLKTRSCRRSMLTRDCVAGKQGTLDTVDAIHVGAADATVIADSRAARDNPARSRAGRFVSVPWLG
ncbi:MAG TPA: hypothetical protein PKK06_09915 [Phycisphaerae bacterium]|nr:hypothetical protein [Phycisphaerae bacterium]HNU45658.1 hypothetical protein [Phycisphaerae bacterium]